MDNNSQDFPYSEEEYQGRKNARKPGEDDSKRSYVKWRVDRDKKNEESSDRLKKMFEESDERVSKLSPDERKGLEEARRRHSRKARIEEETNYTLRHKKEDNEDQS